MPPSNYIFRIAGLIALIFSSYSGANPLLTAGFEKLIPSDKKLSSSWVRSLVERGEPEVYRGSELKYIGMPIGGFYAGQLYLGGDGKLWLWDIFNENLFTGSAHYAHPMLPSSPLDQGFSLKIGERRIPLDAKGFADISFRGEYPVGTVEYKDPSVPLSVRMESFSPFIPLDTPDSSLPATIMRFTLRNTSSSSVDAVLIGSLENAVALHHRDLIEGFRHNKVISEKHFSFLECSAEPLDEPTDKALSEIILEDWNKKTYEGWKVEGKAFGNGPLLKTELIKELGDVGGDTDHVINSHASAPGKSVREKDSALGRLTSYPFPIDRKYLSFWIGGGDHPGKTCVNLLIDGKVVASATGKNSNMMEQVAFDVRKYRGNQAVIEIIDDYSGNWGNIGVGRIVKSDEYIGKDAFSKLSDVGTMGLALLGEKPDFVSEGKSAALKEKLIGELGRSVKLAPGESTSITFAITWYFPNLNYVPKIPEQGRSYSSRFDSALGVASYLAENESRLVDDTLLWKRTWYDSTLPYWFLDRTFLNTSILATSTSLRFKDGRCWAWEGVGDCEGTCGHVYYYGQAAARLFPEIEREQREKVDFATSQQPDGSIHFRGVNNKTPAIDAQAGYILRALREHQLSTDDAFLKRIWPKVKMAMDWMIAKDGTSDGIIKGNQHNTLDTDWYGSVAWLSGIYQAALRASAEMADLMNDAGYAKKCREIANKGRKKMVKELFNGEYFQNKVDPHHLDSINSGTGCEIDQVLGQSWAFQVGLPRVFPKQETVSALNSLWRYNFATDVGPYREANKPGRWYAMPGESGLIMCTFPRSDWSFAQASGKGKASWAAGYFNECMNGFEHQVAGHMIWEGMVKEGLAVERALHDRYAASKRNPYNEIECGDHYGRSMASYGVFLAACGFEYNGPAGHIGFAPRLTPENFKVAFTAAEGWGSFSQTIDEGIMMVTLDLKWGKLRLNSISLSPPFKPTSVVVRAGDKVIDSSFVAHDGKVIVTLSKTGTFTDGQSLAVDLQR